MEHITSYLIQKRMYPIKKVNWEKALEYIKEYPEKEKQHA